MVFIKTHFGKRTSRLGRLNKKFSVVRVDLMCITVDGVIVKLARVCLSLCSYNKSFQALFSDHRREFENNTFIQYPSTTS